MNNTNFFFLIFSFVEKISFDCCNVYFSEKWHSGVVVRRRNCRRRRWRRRRCRDATDDDDDADFEDRQIDDYDVDYNDNEYYEQFHQRQIIEQMQSDMDYVVDNLDIAVRAIERIIPVVFRHMK